MFMTEVLWIEKLVKCFPFTRCLNKAARWHPVAVGLQLMISGPARLLVRV
jgi:hypothetical protein